MLFDDERMSKIRKRCRRTAKRWGFAHEAEDFTGWVLLKIVEGRKASIAQLAIDYQREEWGDGRKATAAYKDARRAEKWALPITEDDENGGVIVAAPSTDNTLLHLSEALSLSKESVAAFLMCWCQGMKNEDVAEIMGVSKIKLNEMVMAVYDGLLKNEDAKELLFL